MNAKFFRQSIPAHLAQAVSGYVWREVHVGCSATRVFRLEAENEKSLYLKICARTSADSLLPEKLKLDWLQNRLPVPEVLLFAEDAATEYLLLTEVSGVDASDIFSSANQSNAIEQLVKGLQAIHRLPIEDCPFDARLNYKIELAEKRMLRGLVNENDFDDERAGRTAEELFQELIENKPDEEDLVFTHGDYCLPNIIIENGKLSGFIDWGNAGVADCYQDIALLSRSVASNFGAQATQNLFDVLGIEPDARKIKFYTLLDEFF